MVGKSCRIVTYFFTHGCGKFKKIIYLLIFWTSCLYDNILMCVYICMMWCIQKMWKDLLEQLLHIFKKQTFQLTLEESFSSVNQDMMELLRKGSRSERWLSKPCPQEAWHMHGSSCLWLPQLPLDIFCLAFAKVAGVLDGSSEGGPLSPVRRDSHSTAKTGRVC